MFDLDNPNPWRTDGHDVDLVRLKLMRDGEREVRQQNPLVVARQRLQTMLQVLDGFPFALIGHRPAVKNRDSHRFTSLLRRTLQAASERCGITIRLTRAVAREGVLPN
ncbi:MAG TPA: hypothetical protein PLF81_08250 [Candidatus Anammoximicrobium sp.]|nr:hypothetical protein [Candidatus Anammoximicrobium sp.]